MNKRSIVLIFLIIHFCIACSISENESKNHNKQKLILEDNTKANYKKTYNKLGLAGLLEYSIFEKAMIGLNSYKQFNEIDIITIIDYSKASTEKRFFVIDLKKKKLLYHELVAHGKNSGGNFATKFSNIPQSKMTSLGIFKTAETYNGKHGYSLKLDGLDEGINDKARERLIVIHGADYVSEAFIKTHRRLGRSWGCPALTKNKSKEIIDKIKNGTCLFIYGEFKDSSMH